MFAIVVLIWLLSLVVVALPAYGAALLAGWAPVPAVAVACAAWTASAVLILARPVESGLAWPWSASAAGPAPTRAATCSGSRRNGRSTRSRSAAMCWP